MSNDVILKNSIQNYKLSEKGEGDGRFSSSTESQSGSEFSDFSVFQLTLFSRRKIDKDDMCDSSSFKMALFGMAWLLKVREEIRKEQTHPLPAENQEEKINLPTRSNVRRVRRTDICQCPCVRRESDRDPSHTPLCDLVLVKGHGENHQRPGALMTVSARNERLLDDGVPPPPPPPAALLRRPPPPCSCHSHPQVPYTIDSGRLGTSGDRFLYDLTQNPNPLLHHSFCYRDEGKA